MRTVYRDIRSLEQAGIPLIGVAGVGYSMVEGFRLPPVMFTQEEAIAFLTAEKMVAQLTDGPTSKNFNSALYKIKAVLNTTQKDLLESINDHIEVFRRRGDVLIQPDLHLIEPVLKSVSQNMVLSIQYFSQYKQEITARLVEPLGVFYTDNYWHLIAWCRMRNDYRDFRLDRISSISLREIPFEKAHPSLKEYLETRKLNSYSGDANMPLIVIRIDKTKAFWLNNQKYFNGFISEKEIGQEVEMTFLSSSMESFARWYLMFGDYARILEPEGLKDTVKSMLSAISKKL